MRIFTTLLILLFAGLTANAQRADGRAYLKAVEEMGLDKAEMIGHLETNLVEVIQAGLPGYKVRSIHIDPKTGDPQVKAVDPNGKSVTLDRAQVLKLENNSAVDDAENGNAVFGFFRCIKRLLWDWKPCRSSAPAAPVAPAGSGLERYDARMKAQGDVMLHIQHH